MVWRIGVGARWRPARTRGPLQRVWGTMVLFRRRQISHAVLGTQPARGPHLSILRPPFFHPPPLTLALDLVLTPLALSLLP
eukprot:6993182-Pyramimonas_sp.AAC.1